MRALIFGLGVLVLGCADARAGAGAECARNSGCAAPLVCALEHCRVECNSSRDCPVGASCILAEGFGVCQLPSETECSVADECPSSLVCAADRCVNTCGIDTDCAPGAACRESACIEPPPEVCSSDVSCSEGLACVDGRCQLECRSSRDCRFGLVCDPDGRCTEISDAASDVSDAGVDVPAPDVGDGRSACPAPVRTAVDVAAGHSHVCAVYDDGSVHCWGRNFSGELGNATVPLSTTAATPVRVTGIGDARSVEAGSNHTCVVHDDGHVSCWGDNGRGQVGIGSAMPPIRTPIRVPSPVALLTNVVALGLDRFGTCAVDDETVWCWGSATASGMTGFQPSPVLAAELPPARSVALHSNGGVVLSTTGTLVYWGQSPSDVYDPMLAFDDGIQVEDDDSVSCVVRGTGELWCAGDNAIGQLGDPARGVVDYAFTSAVPGLTGVVQVATRLDTTCARTTTAEVYCWGNNNNGQLGVGDTMNRDTPALVDGAATDITIGSSFACGIFDGRVSCWGNVPAFDTLVDSPTELECAP